MSGRASQEWECLTDICLHKLHLHNGIKEAALPLVMLEFVASKSLTSVKALSRLRRSPKFLLFQIILQSFQNWIQLNEFLERESNSLSPFVAGPGINYKLYCCFLHAQEFKIYWMMSSWRGFARDWDCVICALNHFNVWLCRASAGESEGWVPLPAELNSLLNWLFCCKWNRFGQIKSSQASHSC